jgi:hypothetical protein
VPFSTVRRRMFDDRLDLDLTKFRTIPMFRPQMVVLIKKTPADDGKSDQ